MTEKKRPGTQSDEDRALQAIRDRRATPATGVPTDEFNRGDEDFTPVGKVIDRIEEVMVLDERDRLLLRLFWQHTANMEMRSRKRSDSQDTSILSKRIDDAENRLIAISGERGDNGTLGNLRKAVDGILSKSWWLVTALVGGVGAAAIKLVIVGRAYGELETQVKANTSRIQLIENVTFFKSFPKLPGLTPEKDPSP